ncbi:MAG: hypothetical protein AB2693_34400 [Candidatus Thiodiazotropha sp.]
MKGRLIFALRRIFEFLENLVIKVKNMAYSWRGRGPRTRGGIQGGRISDNVSARYARNDSNIFSCLRGTRGTGDFEQYFSSVSDTDTDELLSDKSDTTFHEVRYKKKRKLNSSSGGGSKLVHSASEEEAVDYQTLPVDEKINIILSKVTLNENRFKHMENVFETIGKEQKKLLKVESVVRSHEDRIRLLEYKSIDLEARSRRNNILFHGLRETRNENCIDIVCQFVQDQLQIQISDLDISRAHRLGRFDRNRDRPIIVAFQAYPTAEKIMKQGYCLKDTNFSISRDYPLEIIRARKTLWPEYKQIKVQNPNAKVAIVYPAKLIINGRVVKDLFPEWDNVLRGSRIDLKHASQYSFSRKIVPAPATSRTAQSTPLVTDNLQNLNADNRMEVTVEVVNEDSDTREADLSSREHSTIVDPTDNVDLPANTSVNTSVHETLVHETPATIVTEDQVDTITNVCGAAADSNSVFKEPEVAQNQKSVHRTRSETRSGARKRSVSRPRERNKAPDTQCSERTDSNKDSSK